MLLLIAVWIYFLRRMGYLTKYQRNCMDEWHKQNESLARIAAALEKRVG
jgi:hypothetical protein